jgi:hypothetical protein
MESLPGYIIGQMLSRVHEENAMVPWHGFSRKQGKGHPYWLEWTAVAESASMSRLTKDPPAELPA